MEKAGLGLYVPSNFPTFRVTNVSPGSTGVNGGPACRRGPAFPAEKVFVIRNHAGLAEHVPVSKGAPVGDLMEVFGNLNPGDQIVKRASDEIRAGQPIK